MKESFRQSMAWLHTWTGLVAGWLLFFVFVTGTAAYFKDDITRWMKPELPLPAQQAAPPAAAMLERALDFLARQPEAADAWEIQLPAEGQRNGCGPGCERPLRGYPSALTVTWAGNTERLDSLSGEPLPPLPVTRDTEGGDRLEDLHFKLHYVSQNTGTFIVAIVAMLGLLAVVTGIIVHKRIFRDFFTFRPRKGQRSWLDAHNAFGVMALPFFLMILYSGLAEQGYMPKPLITAPALPGGPHHDHLTVQRPRAAMAPLIARAEAVLGTDQIAEITVSHDPDEGPRISMSRFWGSEYPFASREGSQLVFDANSGAELDVPYTFGQPLPHKALWWLVGAHFAWFAGDGLRWLSFGSGLLGCAMIATGLVLWTVKRRERHARRGDEPAGLEWVERLNLGVIIGLPIALAAYFWANRLLPLSLAERAAWEVDLLFLAWLWSLAWALLRPLRQGWVELSALAAASLAAVPLINVLTTDRHLGVTLVHGDWRLAAVDLTLLGLGLLFAVLTWRLQRHAQRLAQRDGWRDGQRNDQRNDKDPPQTGVVTG